MIPSIKISIPRIVVKYFFEASFFLLDCITALKIANLFLSEKTSLWFLFADVIDKGDIGRYNDRDFNLNNKFRVREVF